MSKAYESSPQFQASLEHMKRLLDDPKTIREVAKKSIITPEMLTAVANLYWALTAQCK